MNIFNSVFVDCTASAGVASLYKDLLMHNVSVVAATKIAASSEYENYRELKQIARQRGVKYLFETCIRDSIHGIGYRSDAGSRRINTRLLDLYGGSHAAISAEISGAAYTDEQIAETVKNVWTDEHYLLDVYKRQL